MTSDPIDDRGREAAALQAALAASGVVGTWDWNPVSRRVRCDRGAAELLAGDAALAGRDLPLAEATAGIHPDDRRGLADEVARAAQAGGLFLAEYRAGLITGAPRRILSRGRIFHDRRGRPVRSSGILIDVTEGRSGDPDCPAAARIGPEAPLLRAADLCIAMRTALDDGGSEALRALIDRLLFQFGAEIARSEHAVILH